MKPELYAMVFLLTQTPYRHDKLLLEILKFTHIKTDAMGHQEDFEKDVVIAHHHLCKALYKTRNGYAQNVKRTIQELKKDFTDIAYWDNLPNYLVEMDESLT